MNVFDEFYKVILSFLVGIFIFLLGMSIAVCCSIKKPEKPYYNYLDIDGMTCIKINDDFVSCDWSEWNNKRLK